MIYFIKPRKYNDFYVLAKQRVTDIYVVKKPIGFFDNNGKEIIRDLWCMWLQYPSTIINFVEYG